MDNMKELQKIRKQIDAIDYDIIKLIEQRLEYAVTAGKRR